MANQNPFLQSIYSTYENLRSGVTPGPSIEDQNRMANAPAVAPVQQQGAVARPAAAANPMDALNKRFGLNIGAPVQNMQANMKEGAQPVMDQMAQGLAQTAGQTQAAQFAERMAAAGGFPDPSMPAWMQARQQKTAEVMWRQMQGAPAAPNRFMPPGNAYMGGGMAPTGVQVLAAGGDTVTGYGGTQIRAETVAGQRDGMTSGRPDMRGSHNRFILTQNPETRFLPKSEPAPQSPAQTTPTQPAGDPLAAAQQRMVTAMAPNEPDRYTRTGPMSRDGKYIGDGAFDKKTGRIGIMVNGELQPLPEGTEPITATGLQKSIPDMKQFRALKGELTDAEISLRNMDRYMKSVGGSTQGANRLATQFVTGIKTLVGQGLNTQEIATKMAQGQMQGLLGANRTNVVGGGVMTEQDALRIIQRLGGDVNALQNPEIVRRAIAEVYSDRYAQYQDSLKFYNASVGDYYGSRGFQQAEEVKFSESFKFEKPADGAAPVSGLTDAQKARRDELRKKRDQAQSRKQ